MWKILMGMRKFLSVGCGDESCGAALSSALLVLLGLSIGQFCNSQQAWWCTYSPIVMKFCRGAGTVAVFGLQKMLHGTKF